MKSVEFQWLYDEPSLKEGLKKLLGSSGQLIKKHFSGKEQDRSIRARDLARLPIEFINHSRINPEFLGPVPLVIKETENIIAVHKPANLHCHPLSYDDVDTILNFLVTQNLWKPLEVNKDNYDRGLLFRLDFETSGILLLAKNQTAYDDVRKNFQTKIKQKIYWAIVDGDFDRDGIWSHHFQPSGAKGAKQKVSLDPQHNSTEGKLTVKKVMTENGKSLVMVKLESGLRHQIRAQLSALGYPIIGDELYDGKKAERLFLHAFRYESDEVFEDARADLFDSYFDLNRALQMSHDMLRSF